MSSLMHTIYEVVGASINHSSGSSKTLRVKLTVSPEPSSKRKECLPANQGGALGQELPLLRECRPPALPGPGLGAGHQALCLALPTLPCGSPTPAPVQCVTPDRCTAQPLSSTVPSFHNVPAGADPHPHRA